MQSKRGFTLIELMVIVAVVAVLATVGLPSFRALLNFEWVKRHGG